MTKRILVGKG